MFWKRNNNEQQSLNLAKPIPVPDTVNKNLLQNKIVDAELLPFLKAVAKNSEKGGKVKDMLIFDPADAEARGIKTLNYDSVKSNSAMIIAEGWLDEATKKVEFIQKKNLPKMQFLTYEDILKKIQELKEPGSSVFFYVAAGGGTGGPLGRGAALVRINTPDGAKKNKKYSISFVDIVDMQPTNNIGTNIFDSDKPIEIAKWVADTHKSRFC
jgi:hypothetical protein